MGGNQMQVSQQFGTSNVPCIPMSATPILPHGCSFAPPSPGAHLVPTPLQVPALIPEPLSNCSLPSKAGP